MSANHSFEGIGQWAATFACNGVQAGQAVKISGGGTVAACADEEDFCGVVLTAGRDGKACTVALGGVVTAGWSGETAPTAGWCILSADGAGGVCVGETGTDYLVVDVDAGEKRVTFVI